MVENIQDVAYNYTPQYENMFSSSSLMIENLSIANIITRARKDPYNVDSLSNNLFVVYSDEIQASNKAFVCKVSSLMPNIPMFLELMIMIFANTVFLETNEKHDRITHIKIGSSELPITHWLSRNDVM